MITVDHRGVFQVKRARMTLRGRALVKMITAGHRVELSPRGADVIYY